MTTIRPDKNTYWVRPGQLLAGEYPGAIDRDAAAIKLARFLDCGVSYFIDLTVEAELCPYADLLASLAQERNMSVTHQRFTIPDKGLPASTAQMREILQCLHAALNEKHLVYVHCFGGIGRTGTVIGCYLSEMFADTQMALQDLAMLWQQMDKKTRWPRTPETDAQLGFIQTWLSAK